MNEIIVGFYDKDEVDDNCLKYAVIVSRYHEKWVFVRHRERLTWEIPGGRREVGETIIETANRELKEETGAVSYRLEYISVYSVKRGSEESFGGLFFAEITGKLNPLEQEIVEVQTFESPPNSLTYPDIQPYLYSEILKRI